MTETYCPYCGSECRADRDSDAGYCRECDHVVVPVEYGELENELQEAWE